METNYSPYRVRGRTSPLDKTPIELTWPLPTDVAKYSEYTDEELTEWLYNIDILYLLFYNSLYEMPKMLTHCYSPDDRGEIDWITKYMSALKWRIVYTTPIWDLVVWEKGLHFQRTENEKLFFFFSKGVKMNIYFMN